MKKLKIPSKVATMGTSGKKTDLLCDVCNHYLYWYPVEEFRRTGMGKYDMLPVEKEELQCPWCSRIYQERKVTLGR